MQLVFLPKKENTEIQSVLKLECIKTNYIDLIDEITSFLNVHNSDTRTKFITENLIYIINKILLDDIFKYVATKASNDFIRLVTNNTFTENIYINPFYILQLLDPINIPLENRLEVENMLNKKLQKYISYIYKNNKKLDILILNMFNIMLNNFSHLNFIYYKFELYNSVQPILLFEENENYIYK